MMIQGILLGIRGFLVFEDDPLSLANPDSKLEWQNKIEIIKKVESGLVQSFSGSILRMTYERKEQFSWQSGEVERCQRSRRVD